jgi:hypothetical protein
VAELNDERDGPRTNEYRKAQGSGNSSRPALIEPSRKAGAQESKKVIEENSTTVQFGKGCETSA